MTIEVSAGIMARKMDALTRYRGYLALARYLANGTITLDERETSYVGKASDGQLVTLGVVGMGEDSMAEYLADNGPDRW